MSDAPSPAVLAAVGVGYATGHPKPDTTATKYVNTIGMHLAEEWAQKIESLRCTQTHEDPDVEIDCRGYNSGLDYAARILREWHT